MPVTPGTANDVQRAFEEAFKAVPNCQIMQDLTDYDRLFRSVLEPTWEKVSETIERITVDPSTSIFRVACRVTLDSHGDGIGAATVATMHEIKNSLASIADGAAAVVARILPASVEDVPFGQNIGLTAHGIIEREQ